MSNVAVAELHHAPFTGLWRRLSRAASVVVDLAEQAPATLVVLIVLASVWVVERHVIGLVHDGRHIGYLAVGALPNGDIAGRGSPDQWWRFISSGLVHDSSSPLHLLGNGVALLAVGSTVERLYGRLVMTACLVLGVVAGGVAWLGASALGLVAVPDYTVGCSAGICALIGVMLVYGYRERHEIVMARAVAMRAQAALGVALMLLVGLIVPNLNNIAHAGGFICGALVALVLPTQVEGGRTAIDPRVRATAAAMLALGLVAVGFAAQNLVGRLTG